MSILPIKRGKKTKTQNSNKYKAPTSLEVEAARATPLTLSQPMYKANLHQSWRTFQLMMARCTSHMFAKQATTTVTLAASRVLLALTILLLAKYLANHVLLAPTIPQPEARPLRLADRVLLAHTIPLLVNPLASRVLLASFLFRAHPAVFRPVQTERSRLLVLLASVLMASYTMHQAMYVSLYKSRLRSAIALSSHDSS